MEKKLKWNNTNVYEREKKFNTPTACAEFFYYHYLVKYMYIRMFNVYFNAFLLLHRYIFMQYVYVW